MSVNKPSIRGNDGNEEKPVKWYEVVGFIAGVLFWCYSVAFMVKFVQG